MVGIMAGCMKRMEASCVSPSCTHDKTNFEILLKTPPNFFSDVTMYSVGFSLESFCQSVEKIGCSHPLKAQLIAPWEYQVSKGLHSFSPALFYCFNVESISHL